MNQSQTDSTTLPEQLPPWLKRRLGFLRKTGNLNLSGEKQINLALLGHPDFSGDLTFVKTLDISNTAIESLENLPFIPRLQSFVARNTQISNCTNFSAIAHASKIVLKGSPITKVPHFKLSILLALGDQLTSIDGQLLSETLKNRAAEYPEVSAQLVSNGWMAEYPCPDSHRINQLIQEYDVEEEKIGDQILAEEDFSDFIDEEEEEEEDLEFDDIAQPIRDRQEAMFAQAQEMFDIFPEDIPDNELPQRIADLFAARGIIVQIGINDNIVQAVEDLCRKATNYQSDDSD